VRVIDVACSAGGAGADAHAETRCLCARDLGLYAVVDARGPGNGGWHRPTGVGPAWNALLSRMRRARGASQAAVIDGLNQANAAALASSSSTTSVALGFEAGPALTHSTLSLVMIAVHDRVVVAGGVGNCRVYRRRDARWSVVVSGHTTGPSDQPQGLPKELQTAPSQVLGLEVAITPEIWSDESRTGDTFYLCSSALWSSAEAVITSHVEGAAALAADCAALDAVREGAASGYAISFV
jgi:hypothetical protein